MSANSPVIGITGGVATGKSTVVKYLKKHFKYCGGADEIARKLVEKGKPAYKKIIRAFGKDILAGDGSLDRKKLASRIFGNKKDRKRLEKITHPAIISTIRKTAAKYKKQGKPVIFEAPLLFEAKMEKTADVIVVVASSKKKQVARFVKKGHTKKDALLRINAQLPMEKKIKKADIVLYNNGSLSELEKNVRSLAMILKEL